MKDPFARLKAWLRRDDDAADVLFQVDRGREISDASLFTADSLAAAAGRIRDRHKGVNAAPGLGPALLAQGAPDEPDARAIGRSPGRRRQWYAEAVAPVLVIDPSADPGEGAIHFLNDRGYTVILAPPHSVKMLASPAEMVFTDADVSLCREFARLDEADSDHAKAMKLAAEGLAKRIEDALVLGAS